MRKAADLAESHIPALPTNNIARRPLPDSYYESSEEEESSSSSSEDEKRERRRKEKLRNKKKQKHKKRQRDDDYPMSHTESDSSISEIDKWTEKSGDTSPKKKRKEKEKDKKKKEDSEETDEYYEPKKKARPSSSSSSSSSLPTPQHIPPNDDATGFEGCIHCIFNGGTGAEMRKLAQRCGLNNRWITQREFSRAAKEYVDKKFVAKIASFYVHNRAKCKVKIDPAQASNHRSAIFVYQQGKTKQVRLNI